MNNFAKISKPFWLPLGCLAMLFASFLTPAPGVVSVYYPQESAKAADTFPGSVLSVDYSKLAYLSKIAPETAADLHTEKKAFKFSNREDGKLTPQNGRYLVASKFIDPGLSIRKLLYPFHSFL